MRHAAWLGSYVGTGWRPRWPRRLLLIQFLALLTLASSQPVVAPSASAAPLALLEVRGVGWSDRLVPGSWSPVRLRVTAGQSALSGEVEVVVKGFTAYSRSASTPSGSGPAPAAALPRIVVTSTGSSSVAYGQALALPAQASAEVVVWLPPESEPVGFARLVVDGASVAEATLPQTHREAWPLVGVLAADSRLVGRLAALDPGAASGSPRLIAMTVPAGELPTQAELLGGLAGLVVQGNAPLALSAAQRLAVRDWVDGGGHLVVVGGLGARAALAALPPGTLPLTLGSVDGSASLTDLAGWVGAAEPLAGPGPVVLLQSTGAPLAGRPERPLAWRFSLGAGWVTVLAVDPGLEPLASWPGTPALLRRALEPSLPVASEPSLQRAKRLADRNVASHLERVAGQVPPGAFPSWQVVAMVLGGFAVLAGPLTHLVLARLDRRTWLWLVVPAEAALVGGLLYLVGVGRDGRDVLSSAVGYVWLNPEHGRARQSLAIGFYAPLHPGLTATLPADSLAWPAGDGGPSQPTAPTRDDSPRVRSLAGLDRRIEFLADPAKVRTVLLERWLGSEVGVVVGDLERRGAVISGSVRNNTPFALDNAAIVVDDRFVKLGQLAPGETRPLPEASLSATPARTDPPLARRLVLAPVHDDPTARSPEAWPRDAEAARQIDLLSAVLALDWPPRPGPASVARFFAFTREPVGPAIPSADGRPIHHLTLFEQRLALKST